jgi:hypothetical protein
MNIVVTIGALLCTVLIAALFVIMRRMTAAGRNLPLTAEWIDELSIERYKPMMRLLDGADIEFLRTQPGFTPEAAAKLRVQRCHIFRGYLKCLSADFGRICGAIRIFMLQSGHDRPELATALVRHQVLFAAGLLAVNFRLTLYRFGVCGVDVTTLVKIFDLMRLELHSMAPSAAPIS